MFFKKEKLRTDLPILVCVMIYAYFINWYSGNRGVLPIDTFSFLDSGNSVLQGHLPIRDFSIDSLIINLSSFNCDLRYFGK